MSDFLEMFAFAEHENMYVYIYIMTIMNNCFGCDVLPYQNTYCFTSRCCAGVSIGYEHLQLMCVFCYVQVGSLA